MSDLVFHSSNYAQSLFKFETVLDIDCISSIGHRLSQMKTNAKLC